MKKLPELPYAYNALEPFIDAKTMKIHYSKHYATYYEKFISALKKEEKTEEQSDLIKIFTNIHEYSVIIRNNAGGFWNHTFYFEGLKKNISIPKDFKKILEESFGSIKNFKKIFTEKSLGVFGSGWTWLLYDKDMKMLKISTTKNQDNPLMDDIPDIGTPLLWIDLWEHAYYLKHQNKRVDYVWDFFEVIDWEKVYKRFLAIP